MRVIHDARTLVRGLLIAWSVAVAAITLTPSPGPDAGFGPVRAVLAWLDDHGVAATYPGLESAANVVMFVPFGLLLGLLLPRSRWWLVVVAGAALSVAIELAQLWFLPSRVADVRDVVANTAGATIGVLLALPRRLPASQPRGTAPAT